jgi:hypothetical protein
VRRIPALLLAGLSITLSACTSTARPDTTTARGAQPTPSITAAASPTPSASPSMAVIPPLPSGGFFGPGAFVVTWAGAKFIVVTCPTTHPTATCYTGTASANLPIIGRASLNRTVEVGDESAIAPPGCVTAVTDGTVTSATGAFTFHASGLLCERTSAFTLTSSRGTGSMSGYALNAQIINDSTSETWTGEIAPRQ